MYVYVYMQVCMYAAMYVCMHVWSPVCMCVCAYVNVYACITFFCRLFSIFKATGFKDRPNDSLLPAWSDMQKTMCVWTTFLNNGKRGAYPSVTRGKVSTRMCLYRFRFVCSHGMPGYTVMPTMKYPCGTSKRCRNVSSSHLAERLPRTGR